MHSHAMCTSLGMFSLHQSERFVLASNKLCCLFITPQLANSDQLTWHWLFVITKAGSPGGGQCIAPRLAEVCDSLKRAELECTIFGSAGLRSRYPLAKQVNGNMCVYVYLQFLFLCNCISICVQDPANDAPSKLCKVKVYTRQITKSYIVM